MTAILLLVPGCHDGNVAGPPPVSEGEYGLEAFPQEPGDRWTYALIDTALGRGVEDPRFCTLQVTVARRETMDALGPAAVWILDCDGDADTLYLPARGDTVSFYRLIGGVPTRDRTLMPTLVFPLAVGKTWRDTRTRTEVDSTTMISTPAGAFRALHVLADSSQPNAPHGQDVFIVPDVGVVKMEDTYFFTLGFSGYRRELELLDYSLIRPD